MRLAPRDAVIPIYLLLCLTLGGSEQGLWRNLILQLLGLAIIVWSLWRRQPLQSRSEAHLWVLVAAAVALGLLQLVPLPPSLWTAMPGREQIADGYRLLGQSMPWLPLSLAPYQTSAALLSFIPPLAVLTGVLRLGPGRADLLGAAIVAGALMSVLLGALQASAGGPYFFPIHNSGATGLFANSNHMGILLVAAIPFLTALCAESVQAKERGSTGGALLIMGGSAALVVATGLTLSKSLAALALAVPATIASLLLVRPVPWSGRIRAIVLGTAAMLPAAALVFLLVGSSPDNAVSWSTRLDIYERTVRAIGDFMPFGSGLGTFPNIYPLYEDPVRVTRWFVNHAHSDYLEIALELGLAGVVLTILFLVWWAREAVRLVASRAPTLWAGAAAIASGAFLVHAFVDFPLRTSALAAVFAACVGMMADRRSRLLEKDSIRPARHLWLETGPSA